LPEWVIEEGIGETRAALIEDDDIVEARVRRDGVIPAGTVLEAKLVAVAPRVTVEADGQEFLLPRGVTGLSEGRAIRIAVTREALGGIEPWKRGLAYLTTDMEARAAAPLEGRPGTIDVWDDLLEEARSGIVRFEGGELRIEPTAAMTMIDVDGWLVPDKLAQMGAWAADFGRPSAPTIRKNGHQRLRIRADRPPAYTRVANRIGARSGGVRSTGATSTRGIRDARREAVGCSPCHHCHP
jgi:hypothetical protein